MQVRRTAVCLAILAVASASLIGYFFGIVAALAWLALVVSASVLFFVRSRALGSEPKRIVTPNERRHGGYTYRGSHYRDRWPGEPPHR